MGKHDRSTMMNNRDNITATLLFNFLFVAIRLSLSSKFFLSSIPRLIDYARQRLLRRMVASIFGLEVCGVYRYPAGICVSFLLLFYSVGDISS